MTPPQRVEMGDALGNVAILKDGRIITLYARPERDWRNPIRELVLVDPEWLEGRGKG